MREHVFEKTLSNGPDGLSLSHFSPLSLYHNFHENKNDVIVTATEEQKN